MGVTPSPAPSNKRPELPSTDTHLAGRRLLLARLLWGALASLGLGLFLLLLPTYWVLLQTVCTTGSCALVQPTPYVIHALHQLGLPLSAYAAGTFGITLVTTTVCWALGGFLFWRRSNDWMALLVALAEVAFGILYITDAVQTTSSAWQVPAISFNVLGNGVVFLLGYRFPSGEWVPRWSRWLLLCWFGWGVSFLLVHARPVAYLLDNAVWLTMLASVVVAQSYRYRYRSTLIHRQQTKWAVLGGALTTLLLVGLTLPRLFLPLVKQSDSLYTFVTGPLYPLGTLLVSFSLALAIFRYRLFDVDTLINRTLVYGSLSLILAALYFSLVLGAQVVTERLSGQNEPAIILVASTLLIAALVNPVRHRLQVIVDRRFYRSKYDAEKVLSVFSETLRNEVDLSHLREQVLAVVQETMQPTQVSLWLRSLEAHSEEASYRLDASGQVPANPTPS
jgi:hypothetical protein